MVWSNQCLIVSTCIGLIPPVHVLFSQHITHLTCCCVMWSVFNDWNSIPVAVWCDLYEQYSVSLAWIYSTPNGVVWSDLCLIDSTCIGLIPLDHDLFDQHITDLTCCCVMWSVFNDCSIIPSIWPGYGVTQLVFDGFYLYWTDSTGSWSIRPAYHAFHLLLCAVFSPSP